MKLDRCLLPKMAGKRTTFREQTMDTIRTRIKETMESSIHSENPPSKKNKVTSDAPPTLNIFDGFEALIPVKDPAYEEDAFARSNKCLTSRIQNKKEQFLVLRIDGGERLLEFRPLTAEKLKSASCRFLIQPFRNMNPSSEYPITLQILSEGKTWTLWCLDEGGSKVVYPNLQNPPDKIESTKHEALFFLMKITGHPDWYRVASSMWPSFFLSFECKPENLVKLVLKEEKNDDESLNLKVTNIQRCSQ